MSIFKVKTTSRTSFKGFTLIELLVVIAVLGVMAAAIVAAINPLAKINQAKDSNIKSDLASIANALQSYYVVGGSSASYPVTSASPLTVLTPNELKALPTSATWVYAAAPAGCTGAVASPCTSAAVYATLNITSSGAVWCWKSNGSAPTSMAATSCTAP
jgi:prepilin-type N-terminal cleavage/methylation domain-containing protein